jgi:hypothetical protein
VIDFARAEGSDVDLVLRARSFLRLGLSLEAIEAASFDYSKSTPAVKTERFLIRAIAHGRLGNFEAAHNELVDARAFALGSPFTALEMDVNFTTAYVAYMERDSALAKTMLELPLSFEDDQQAFLSNATPLWDADHVSARAHELRAFLAGAENDQALQAACFRRALERVLASETADKWLAANIASNYGMMLREFPDSAAMDELRAKVHEIEWTTDLDDQRFQLARSFGMSAALSGNHVAAFRFYREAASHAPSSAARVVALGDRALLSRELGHSTGEFLADELDAISDAANRVNWAAIPGEYYVALLLMAQLFAGSDATRAAAYFQRYKELHAQSGRELYGRTDPRRAAAELATAGLIAKARGDRADAQALLERACDGYIAVHCDWRAANVAISLLEIAPTAPSATAVARRVAQQNPASWIARRLAEIPAASTV